MISSKRVSFLLALMESFQGLYDVVLVGCIIIYS